MRARLLISFGLGALVVLGIVKRFSPLPAVERAAPVLVVTQAVIRPETPDAPEVPEQVLPEQVLPDLELAPRVALQSGTLPWEERLKTITDSKTLTEPAKAREILRTLSWMPEEGLETAAQQAADRLPDKEYAAALGWLINPQTHGRVLQVLFADLLIRPDEVTLPALLLIARNEAHPFSRQARENLGLLVDKEFGTDWNRWDAEIRRLLKPEGR